MRLPLEGGSTRLRGFGYAEFMNINDVKEALLLRGEVRWALVRCEVGTSWEVRGTLDEVDTSWEVRWALVER